MLPLFLQVAPFVREYLAECMSCVRRCWKSLV